MASRREHPPETVFKAQELYCVARLTHREIAAEMKVAESTLKRWAAKYGWADKRAAVAQAECDIRADLILARSAMIKKVLEKQDPQAGFAVASLEGVAMKKAEIERAGRMKEVRRESTRQRRVVKTLEDAVAALKETVLKKLEIMLDEPEAFAIKDLRAVKDGMGLLRELEPKQGKTHDEQLSPETIRKIEELYGL